MPQASDEQRARWPGWDAEAFAHLEARGYLDGPNFTWRKPEQNFVPSERDLDAIDFLINEFDWGGLEE